MVAASGINPKLFADFASSSLRDPSSMLASLDAVWNAGSSWLVVELIVVAFICGFLASSFLWMHQLDIGRLKKEPEESASFVLLDQVSECHKLKSSRPGRRKRFRAAVNCPSRSEIEKPHDKDDVMICTMTKQSHLVTSIKPADSSSAVTIPDDSKEWHDVVSMAPSCKDTSPDIKLDGYRGKTLTFLRKDLVSTPFTEPDTSTPMSPKALPSRRLSTLVFRRKDLALKHDDKRQSHGDDVHVLVACAVSQVGREIVDADQNKFGRWMPRDWTLACGFQDRGRPPENCPRRPLIIYNSSLKRREGVRVRSK